MRKGRKKERSSCERVCLYYGNVWRRRQSENGNNEKLRHTHRESYTKLSLAAASAASDDDYNDDGKLVYKSIQVIE